MNSRRVISSDKKPKNQAQKWEQLQLRRLLWALILFLAVFLGKQIYPQRMLSVGEEVIRVLGRTTDFEAVFMQLGESMTRAGGTLDGLEEFCVEVFGTQSDLEIAQVQKTAVFRPQLPETYTGLLTQEVQKTMVFSRDFSEATTVQESGEVTTVPQDEAVTAVGSVLTVGTTPKQALPEGYTVNELSFGTLETVNPVLGYLNSGFGYRDHPVNGKYSFHGGADISANAGDPIGAFADGVVEYVGEDNSYGLYIQLDHGNGIKSFYAHCQSVCVEKGQRVTAGETVAVIGATGTATGPHLHLELKCGDLRVDPAYYIDFL